MDGLTSTIERPVLASAGIEQDKYVRLHEVESSYSALPAPKRAGLLMGDPFLAVILPSDWGVANGEG